MVEAVSLAVSVDVVVTRKSPSTPSLGDPAVLDSILSKTYY